MAVPHRVEIKMDTAIDEQLVVKEAGAVVDHHASAIGVKDLCKDYDGVPAVRGVNFDVKPGEFLTLLGPSGSGKTSTLMLIAGFELPTSGQISLHGRDVVELPPKARNLGIVFQHYSLFPHMSVLDNVAFPLRMRKIGSAERRKTAMEMLERVDLGALSDRRPRQLSGGQQQRVALARALVFDPEALLLDEPLGALDKRLRDQLQIEIKTIQKKLGVSVLFVTHDQNEAMMMSDRIAVMNHGVIEQIATPADLYNYPSTSFIASFLGETNLIPCTVESSNGNTVTVVLADGTRCGAQVQGALRPNRRYGLSVRPERMELIERTAGTDCSVEGTVKSCTFLGSNYRLVIDSLGQELVVSTVARANQATPRANDTVRLGWNTSDAQVITLDDNVSRL